MFPKILHLYWGLNQPLSFLRVATVLTFQRLNPDWSVKVWIPKTPSREKPWRTGEQSELYHGHDHLEEISDLVQVLDFEALGIPDSTPEVHKADLIRWYLLATYGGVWSDFDVAYIRPISEALAESWNGAGLCRYTAIPKSPKLFQVIGFLTCNGPGRIFFNHLFQMGVSRLPQTEYQAFGANLLDYFLGEAWGTMPKLPFYHPPEVVYHYRTHTDIRRYFKPEPIQYADSAIGLHWYAGNPETAQKELLITHENLHKYANQFAICKEVQKCLNTAF